MADSLMMLKLYDLSADFWKKDQFSDNIIVHVQ